VGSPARYWELTVAVPPDATEGLTNFLWESGALGVVEEERPGEAPEVRAFFPDTAPPAVLSERVAAYTDGLAALGFGGVGAPRVTSLEDTGWAIAWREHFRPIAVGRRFVVTPPWEKPDAQDRIVLVIEPGRAFGTGRHGSTAGCLEAIERAIETTMPAYALDVGTGSGILAIALARLGIASVLAVDEDPDAVAAATTNAVANGVGSAVQCRIDDAATLEVQPAPLAVANLTTAAHRRLADRYARFVARSGRLILGGIPDEETPEIAQTMRSRGWRPDETIVREGWSTLLLAREGHDGGAPLHDRT
jgi:ribosomal protein L11 methyltransferase